MKAIHIDAERKTVESVELPDEGAARMERLRELVRCEFVDAVRLETGRDAVFVDDEGLLGDLSRQQFFWLVGLPTPLAGSGVIMGADDEGETVEPVITLEQVKRRVRWVRWNPPNLEFAR